MYAYAKRTVLVHVVAEIGGVERERKDKRNSTDERERERACQGLRVVDMEGREDSMDRNGSRGHKWLRVHGQLKIHFARPEPPELVVPNVSFKRGQGCCGEGTG